MASAALIALTATAPKDLTRPSDLGKSRLHELVIQCQAAGLTAPVDGSNDVALLHALFDVALQNGLGAVVYDYVVEVAADKYCTSSDPVKAYLLDGECVKEWCRNALEREQTHLLQGLARGLASLAGAGQLGRHVACLGSLARIIEALHPAAQDTAGAAQLPPDLQLAQQLHQCAQVSEWLAQHVQGVLGGMGRFESEPAWRMAVSKRRTAAHPKSTFLQELQETLTDVHGCGAMQYPPVSVEKAAQAIFLTGATNRAAWRAKLSMLVYYLLDAGLAFPEASFMQAFSVGPAQLVEWQAYFQLDDALLGTRSSLDSACQSLPAAVGPGSAFKLVETLAALGRAREALTVLRAQRSDGGARREPDQALRKARVGLQIRLSCNLLTDAFMEAQQYCSSVAPEQRSPHVRELVRCLADWAEAHRALNAVIQLPLNPLEEEMLVEWLRERLQKGKPCGRYLVLLYLVRGRLPEALNAHKELLNSCSGPADEEGPLAALSSILESAAALVPQQAAMAAHKGGGANGGQPLGGLFSRSLLLPRQEQWQEAASHDSWAQGAGTLETQPPAPAGNSDQEAPQQAQQVHRGAAGTAESSWATWRADQKGEEPGRVFGQAGDGLRAAQGEQGSGQWQHIIGPPGSRSAARSVKRPRVHRPR